MKKTSLLILIFTKEKEVKTNSLKNGLNNSAVAFDSYKKESDFKKIYEFLQNNPDRLLTILLCKEVLGKTNNFTLIAKTLEFNGYVEYFGNTLNEQSGREIMSYKIIDISRPFETNLRDLPKANRDVKNLCEKLIIQIMKNLCNKKMEDKDKRKKALTQLILITEKMAENKHDSEIMNLFIEGYKTDKIIDLLRFINSITKG
jgi:hypothetical protein